MTTHSSVFRHLHGRPAICAHVYMSRRQRRSCTPEVCSNRHVNEGCCGGTQSICVQGLTLEGVRQKLKEFHDAIGEEGGEEDAQRQRAKVMNLLTGLGYEKPEEPAPQPPPEASANGEADAGESAVQSACGCVACVPWYQA